MTTNETNRINELFIKLESATKAADHFNSRCITSDVESAESYNRVFEETLNEIIVIQKQIIRALLKAGEVSELLSHVDAGTFPQYSIHCAFGKKAA